MPELPEVETVRRRLSARCRGQLITSSSVHPGNGERLPSTRAILSLVGERLSDFERYGKLLIVSTNTRRQLVIHMGMSGRFLFGRPSSPRDGRHDRLVLELKNGDVVRFNDQRRFGNATLYDASHRTAFEERLSHLGPDALSAAFTSSYLAERIARRTAPIKALLLDQHIVAGIGNIYACESLYHAKIAPHRAARSLSTEDMIRLVRAIKVILRRAISVGGSTLADYRGTDGELGTYDRKFAVFARTGQPCTECVCRGGVTQTRLAGRVTYSCEKLQR
jgi:formamidopyrimidine-DNA glycosylase